MFFYWLYNSCPLKNVICFCKCTFLQTISFLCYTYSIFNFSRVNAVRYSDKKNMNTVLGEGYTVPNPDTRSYANVATNDSAWNQLPYGQQFVATFFSSPEITKTIQQNMVPPPVVPSYKSMFNPNNFYAVNGLLSSVGLPKSNVKGLPPSKGKK